MTPTCQCHMGTAHGQVFLKSSIVWSHSFRSSPSWLVVTAVGRNCYSPVFILSPLLLHPRLLERSGRILPFSSWLAAKHRANQGWESTRMLHLYSLVGSFSPRVYVSPKDDGEKKWEQFLGSRPNSLAGVVFKNRVLNSGHPSKYSTCRMTA